MNKLPNHTSLKEWAAVISALGTGDQVILLRKGGIADARFGVEAERFYLLPTYLHQKEKQFTPEGVKHFHATDRPDLVPDLVEVDTWCEVVKTFRVAELERLEQLEPLVVFTGDTIRERYHFRPSEAVHVIAVRAYRLPVPAQVRMRPEYGGCKSWISVEEEIDTAGSTQVLEESRLAERVAEVERALALAGVP